MTFGVVMLAHRALDRAAQVARHFAASGCPVILHIDRRVTQDTYTDLIRSVSRTPLITLTRRRHRCNWGTWGLVRATQDASEELLAACPNLNHVYLASGSCLPLRPVADLQHYLQAQPETDFIESVTIQDSAWSKGGFEHDRFRLHFPLSFRRHRRVFDLATQVQKRIGIERRLPHGLVPHLGSQWWCLTRPTLEAILNAPDRPAFDRFFRTVWIPDESYFQTLVRQHTRHIESRSLTLSKFDHQGKPYTFYDDHLQLLERSECFVARKIWPGAQQLYSSFLTDARRAKRGTEPNAASVEKVFAQATERRERGRTGLWMQSRFPAATMDAIRTAAPYSVFCGFDHVIEGFPAWANRSGNIRVSGHLFAPELAELPYGERHAEGGLSHAARLRDYNPAAFLTNLIWSTRGSRQGFLYGPGDTADIATFIAGDLNAQISIISGAWALSLHHLDAKRALSVQELRDRAATLLRAETDLLTAMRSTWVKARVRIWTLSEFLEAPMTCLLPILDEISPRSPRRPIETPNIRSTEGFSAFLARLNNEGLKLNLSGDFTHTADPAKRPRSTPRLYLVR